MASITFFLKNSKDNHKKSILYIQISYKSGDKRNKIKFSTEEKLFPGEWNQAKQKTKYPEVNEYLFSLQQKARKILREKQNENEIITNEYIREKWNASEKKAEQVQGTSLNDALTEYLNAMKNACVNGTMKQKRSVFKHFNEFCHYSKISFEFDKIDMCFL